MKHTSIRAFVLVLALSGLASTVSAKPSKSTMVSNGSSVTTNVVAPPTCGPGDPNHCGMD